MAIEINFEDPIIKRISQAALILLVIAFVYIALLAALVVVDWDGGGTRSKILLKAISSLPNISGEKAGDITPIFAIIITALPVMAAAVCFTTVDGKKRLNLFGGFMLCGLLAAILLAVYGYLGIDPKWKAGHELGEEGITRILVLTKSALTASVFYVCSLLGLKAQQ